MEPIPLCTRQVLATSREDYVLQEQAAGALAGGLATSMHTFEQILQENDGVPAGVGDGERRSVQPRGAEGGVSRCLGIDFAQAEASTGWAVNEGVVNACQNTVVGDGEDLCRRCRGGKVSSGWFYLLDCVGAEG